MQWLGVACPCDSGREMSRDPSGLLLWPLLQASVYHWGGARALETWLLTGSVELTGGCLHSGGWLDPALVISCTFDRGSSQSIREEHDPWWGLRPGSITDQSLTLQPGRYWFLRSFTQWENFFMRGWRVTNPFVPASHSIFLRGPLSLYVCRDGSVGNIFAAQAWKTTFWSWHRIKKPSACNPSTCGGRGGRVLRASCPALRRVSWA